MATAWFGRKTFTIIFALAIISVVIFYTKFSVSTVHVLDYNNFARLYENSSLKPIKVEIDWKKVNVSTLTPELIIEYFKWSNQTSCKLTHDFGGKMMRNPSGFDGQKAVCLDDKIAPQPGSCIVYSFGINNEWSFDETMEDYGCQVFAFDPTMNVATHKHSQGVNFYNLGIADKDDPGQNYKTLSSIYSMLKPAHGDDAIIDYLKMDIEFNEWTVIPQIIESGMLAKVRQLGIEFHLYAQATDLSWFHESVKIVKSIEDAGMIRFDSKYNPWFVGNLWAMNGVTESLGYEIAWYQILP
jgi:hypothetical protein